MMLEVVPLSFAEVWSTCVFLFAQCTDLLVVAAVSEDT
jgi:hypothetical protein